MPEVAAGVSPVYVDTPGKIQPVLAMLASGCRVGIDTEFVKIDTLHPLASLVQLYDGREVYIIDLVALRGDAAGSFWQALISSPCLFIFFSMREDLDLIRHCAGALPRNIDDLQIMLSFVGDSSKQGLAAAADKYLHVEVLKDQTTSIWMSRPLNQKQIRYAAMDVYHLLRLHDILSALLEERGNTDCYRQDLALGVERCHDEFDPASSYLEHVTPGMGLEARIRLRALVNFRQETASRKNIPLRRIFPDSLLPVLATGTFRNTASLEKAGLHWRASREFGREILNILFDRHADPAGISSASMNSEMFAVQFVASYRERLAAFCASRGIEDQRAGSKRRQKELTVWLSCEDRHLLHLPEMLSTPWRRQILSQVLGEPGLPGREKVAAIPEIRDLLGLPAAPEVVAAPEAVTAPGTGEG